MMTALAILVILLLVLMVLAYSYSWARIWHGDFIGWYLAMETGRAIGAIIVGLCSLASD